MPRALLSSHAHLLALSCRDSLNAQTDENNCSSALSIACEEGRVECARVLLEARADVATVAQDMVAKVIDVAKLIQGFTDGREA